MPRILSQADVADFRERLCVAATRMFDARGPEGFTMRELAAELGVSAMTPYRYFKDKEDILAAVRARAFNRFAEALENALRIEPENEGAVYRAYVAFAFGEPAAYKLMFDLTQPDESLYPDLVKANARARDNDRLCQAHDRCRKVYRRRRTHRTCLLGGAARRDRAETSGQTDTRV